MSCFRVMRGFLLGAAVCLAAAAWCETSTAATQQGGTGIGGSSIAQTNDLKRPPTQNAQWAIIASAGPNGTIWPTGTVFVPDGSNCTFSLTAFHPYHIADVVVDGVSEGATDEWEFK